MGSAASVFHSLWGLRGGRLHTAGLQSSLSAREARGLDSGVQCHSSLFLQFNSSESLHQPVPYHSHQCSSHTFLKSLRTRKQSGSCFAYLARAATTQAFGNQSFTLVLEFLDLKSLVGLLIVMEQVHRRDEPRPRIEFRPSQSHSTQLLGLRLSKYILAEGASLFHPVGEASFVNLYELGRLAVSLSSCPIEVDCNLVELIAPSSATGPSHALMKLAGNFTLSLDCTGKACACLSCQPAGKISFWRCKHCQQLSKTCIEGSASCDICADCVCDSCPLVDDSHTLCRDCGFLCRGCEIVLPLKNKARCLKGARCPNQAATERENICWNCFYDGAEVQDDMPPLYACVFCPNVYCADCSVHRVKRLAFGSIACNHCLGLGYR